MRRSPVRGPVLCTPLPFADLLASVSMLPNSDIEKSQIINDWLSNSQSNCIYSEIRTLIGMVLPLQKSNLIAIWIAKPSNKISFEEFQSLIAQDYQSLDLDRALVNYAHNLKEPLSFEQITSLVAMAQDAAVKNKIIELCFAHNHDAKQNFSNLKLLITAGLIDGQNTERISTLCRISKLSVSQITELCANIYPNDPTLQIELFNKCLLKGLIGSFDSKVVKEFLKEIKDSNLVLTTISTKEFKAIVTPVDLFEICKDRIPGNFSHISVLADLNLKDSLTEEGLKIIQDLFKVVDFSSYKLADLFTYFSINSDFSSFIKIVKPEVLSLIRQEYSSKTSSKCYLTANEYQNLQTLMGSDFPKLPTLSSLCAYLKEVDDNIPPPREDISDYKIHFSQTAMNEQEEAELNIKFKKLLLDNHPSTKAVMDCLTAILGITIESDINQEEQQKLTDFFNHNKYKLAMIFSQDTGVNEFRDLLPCLKDGCSRNIANQFEGAYKRFMIKDPADRMLYLLFLREFRNPIMGVGAVDNFGSLTGEVSPFLDAKITQNFLVTDTLTATIKKELDGKDGNKMAWQIIGAEFTKTYGISLTDDLYSVEQTIGTRLNWNTTDIADLASYLVLKSFGEKNPDIKFFDKNKITEFNKLLKDAYEEVKPKTRTASVTTTKPMVTSHLKQ